MSLSASILADKILTCQVNLEIPVNATRRQFELRWVAAKGVSPSDWRCSPAHNEVRANQRATDMSDELVCQLLGINRTDARCLDILDNYGRLSAGELAGHSGLTTGAITAVVDRLERLGLARRVADPSDRRRVFVELTEKARQASIELFGPMAQGRSGDGRALHRRRSSGCSSTSSRRPRAPGAPRRMAARAAPRTRAQSERPDVRALRLERGAHHLSPSRSVSRARASITRPFARSATTRAPPDRRRRSWRRARRGRGARSSSSADRG